MAALQKLEDIASKEFLDAALENAQAWCLANLARHLQGYNKFNYRLFRYVIDNSLIGQDMCLDDKDPGLIRVSAETLRWYKQREENITDWYKEVKSDLPKHDFREPETDPKSMFIHEMVEFIIYKIPEILVLYFSKMEFPHMVARHIENINRRERGLKDWPDYY